MPTYDYRCNACGHRFELFQSMTESAKRKCPKCEKNALERLIGTGAALIFKGSGFYETDYRSDSYKKAAEADKPADTAKPAPETRAESKTESKAKPEAAAKPEPAASRPSAERKPSKPGRGKSK